MDLEVGSPGSINGFAEQHPDLKGAKVLKAWQKQLIEHRGALAKAMGFEDPEELHRITSVGSVQENLSIESAA